MAIITDKIHVGKEEQDKDKDIANKESKDRRIATRLETKRVKNKKDKEQEKTNVCESRHYSLNQGNHSRLSLEFNHQGKYLERPKRQKFCHLNRDE